MAPPPEHDKEPKAPDKTNPHSFADDQKPSICIFIDQQQFNDVKSTTTTINTENEETKHIETLDDGQLRALLDEAITYKCPKDREGKSSLFKELLEEVEQDEEDCEAGGAGARSWVGGRMRNRRSKRSLPHSNSLQDLVAALAAEPAPRRRHAPVSARTHHGGSLPSGVDRSFLFSEEPVRAGTSGSSGSSSAAGAEYVATVRCVNPSPLTERRVSASDAQNSTEMEVINRRSKIPMLPVTYTARATLEIGSGSVGSGRAVTTTTASNQVDSGITFGCITTPEVVTSCHTTSTTQSTASVDPKPRSVIGSSLNGLSFSRPNYGSSSTTTTDEYKEKIKKALDENGNALQSFSSPTPVSSQHKKPRRKKSSKNETVITSDHIDGYQGNKDLNEVLRFIESNADSGRQKLGRVNAKHKDDDDKSSKKRSSERRIKDKENKIKRANSMEELSRTKLEDLTDKPETMLRKNKKERWTDGNSTQGRKSERRSWGDDSRETFFYSNEDTMTSATVHVPSREKKKLKQNKSSDSAVATTQELHSDTTIELLDFQTVTKKKKPRKRFEETDRESGAGGELAYRKNRPTSPERRRKSAPPSDKSNDSNDDLDSVHSLPAESTSERNTARPASSNGTPQASYADIARTRHNIPDLIESCNFYTGVDNMVTELDEIPHKKKELTRTESVPEPIKKLPVKTNTVEDNPGPTYDVENYPALDSKSQRTKSKETKMSPPTKRIDKKKVTETVTEDKILPTKITLKTVEVSVLEDIGTPSTVSEPPDVVSDRRPPVILLDEATRPRDIDGITFGFDINEQLLNGDSERAEDRPGCDLVQDALAASVPIRAGTCGPHLRYLPPPLLVHSYQLDQIVNFVGNAWEDIIKCGGGKVRYFSE